MQFTVYEMQTNIVKIEAEIGIECIQFDQRFFEEYKRSYNECFYEMSDDLFVDKKYQGRGIGRQLLLWAMKYIRSKNTEIIEK